MKVGIFHVDERTLDAGCGYLAAAALVQSVRTTMPGVQVFHFTDEQSREIDGADYVIRKPRERMARLRMRHHAECHGDWLFLDTDVLVHEDVRSVFRHRFDIAITVRDWEHLKPAAGFTERMPFNTGVVFSKSQQFWADVYDHLCLMPKPDQTWMGDQMAIGDVVATKRFNVLELSGLRYNFPPSIGDDDDGGSDDLEAKAAIVHFKGPKRKPLLLRRLKKELLSCV